MKAKSTTLYDVAQHAGVSYQTVSRVINRAENVSEKTRQRVEAAMAALNYVPNRVAQQLAGKMGHTLGRRRPIFRFMRPRRLLPRLNPAPAKGALT